MKFDPLQAIVETEEHTDIQSQLTLANLPQPIIDILTDTESSFAQLKETLLTQPILADPYNSDDEEHICNNPMGINRIIRNIATLITFAKEANTTPSQRKVVGWWLQSNSISFSISLSIGRFAHIHFRLSTLHLCMGLLNLIEAVKADCDNEHVDYFNSITHALYDKFINACIHSGHYELIPHWIPYFETLPCPLYSNNLYEFYYRKALTKQYYCLLAQLMGEFATSRVYSEQSRAQMHQAVSDFIAIQLSWIAQAQAPEQSSALFSHSLQCFMEATSKFLEIVALSHFAAGGEALQCNNFVDARESFSLYNELINPDTINKMIAKINQALSTKIPFFKPKPTYYTELFSTSNANIRWSIIRNYLLIKRWLSSHLPNNAKLTERNETLILTLNKSASAKKISASLDAHHVTHEVKENDLIFSVLTTLRLDDLVKALTSFQPKSYDHISFVKNHQANDATEALPVIASNDMSIATKEQLRFRRLKNLHYKFSNAYSENDFQLLEKHLNAFYIDCQDPRMKLTTQQLLVCINLSQAFYIWTKNLGPDHERFFASAKKHAEIAHQIAVQHFGKAAPKKITHNNDSDAPRAMTLDPEANRLLAIIDARIDNHEDLLSDFLSQSALAAAVKTVATIKPTASQDRYSFHWMRLAMQNSLPCYNTLVAVRKKIQSKTVCSIHSMYKERETLLYDTNLLCFELAYELFSQSCLVTVEGNTAELAKARIQAEYQNLCETQKMFGFTLPPHIQSYVLVFRTATEQSEDPQGIIKQLDQALTLAHKHTSALHQIDIIVRKIDWHCTIPKNDPFREVTIELKSLFKILKTIESETITKAYCPYIVYVVLNFFCQNISLSQSGIGQLPTAAFKSLVDSFDQQLSIIHYIEEKFLKGTKLSVTELRSKDLANHLKVKLNNGKTIIAGFHLEKTVRQDLASENQDNGVIHFLIPKVLISQANLVSYSGLLIAPNSPLIGLVVGCNQLLKYTATEDKKLAQSSRELLKCYQLIAEQAKQELFILIPTIIRELTSQNSANPDDWFNRLSLLINCLNNATIDTGAAIAREHIPMIENMLRLFPDNPYLSFTLYRAMADNFPRENPSPDTVAACRMAAEAGHPRAEYWYSRMLQFGDYGAEKNLELAATYLQKSSEHGYDRAQLRLAAEAGDAQAEYKYSRMLESGNDKDLELAKIYLAKSCEQKYYKAQIRLAKLHHQGLFGYPQKNEAEELCAIPYAEAAMDNENTPQESRMKLSQRYDILFIPLQFM